MFLERRNQTGGDIALICPGAGRISLHRAPFPTIAAVTRCLSMQEGQYHQSAALNRYNMSMTDDSFADLFNQEEKKQLRRIAPGQKITATIVGISGESVFLDVGGKSEGVMNASEITDSSGQPTKAVGDTIEVYFLKSRSGESLFTRRIGSGSDADHLEEAWRSAIPVEGLVKEEIKGGFEITLGSNVRAFCPYSQISLRRRSDPAGEFIGARLPFRITRFDEGGRNIVVSARAIQEEERAERREELINTLEEGQAIDGTVTSLRDFGAFVDIGGVDALIPISEIGWSRVDNIAEHLSIGQLVKVVIKSLDWGRDRISVSLREALADPWENIPLQFPEGSTQHGRVARLAPFGAFVTLAPGIDGLIHISRLGGGRRIHHPREVLEEGQEIEGKVESLDPAGRKMSLAPADYVSPENIEENERGAYRQYVEKSGRETAETRTGSLGDLLKARLAEKKRR
jgi:small subunit ribosomal protein S1